MTNPDQHDRDEEDDDWLEKYLKEQEALEQQIEEYHKTEEEYEKQEFRSAAKDMSVASSWKEFRRQQLREQQPEKQEQKKKRIIGFATLDELEEYERQLALSHHQLFEVRSRPESLITTLDVLNARLIEYLRRNPDDIYKLPPRRFEELVAEILASFDWRVHLTQATRDGGYDIFAISKDISGFESSWIVECKRYGPDNPIGISVVRELYAVKSDLRVANAIVATTSRFTDGVHKYKDSRYDLQLRDFQGVLEWINHYRPRTDGCLHIENRRLTVKPNM